MDSKAAFKRHPVLSTSFLIALALTLFFVTRLLVHLLTWEGHLHEPIKPWMTIGYVGHSWGLNPKVIDERAGLPLPVNGRPFTLQEIADDRGVPVEDIIKQVEDAVAKLRADKKAGKL
jgi:hypothetical protein